MQALKFIQTGMYLNRSKFAIRFHGIYLSQAHNNKIPYVDIKGMGKGEIAAQGNGIHVYYANDNPLNP